MKQEADLFRKFNIKVKNHINILKEKSGLIQINGGGEGLPVQNDAVAATIDKSTIPNERNNTYEAIIKDLESIQTATDVLKEVKDIRDELNMLERILSQQATVWKQFTRPSKEEMSRGIPSQGNALLAGPDSSVSDIEAMDKMAERIQSAVSSTLSFAETHS